MWKFAVDPNFSLSSVMPQLPKQLGLFVLSSAALVGLATGKLRGTRYAYLPVALVAVDLLATGAGYNLTSDAADVYPTRQSITALQQSAGHDRIMPVNRGWSFAGPKAVLPPNGAMVFGLHDIQGYDSLFPGQYKAFMNELASPDSDASPREVGNMVFAKNPLSPLAAQTGVRFVLSEQQLPLTDGTLTPDGFWQYPLPNSTGRAYTDGTSGRPATWEEDEPTRVTLVAQTDSPANLVLADQLYPGWKTTVDGTAAHITRINSVFRSVPVPAGRHTVRFTYEPTGFRTGLYLALIVCLAASASTAIQLSRRNHA